MLKIYFYVNKLNDIQKSNLIQLKNINIIYRNYDFKDYKSCALELKQFCKKQKFNFFISNDYQLAKKLSADGLYLPSYNTIDKYKNAKIKLIGSAHNELEMHKKISQGCEEVFISPIFNTSSGGSKIGKGLLFYKKFLTQFKSCIKVNALGGIGFKNIRYISNYNGNGFASLSLIEKKISQKFISELKLIATNR